MTTLYKLVGPNGAAINGGSGRWAMPKGKRPGRWMPRVERVEMCRSGYHLIPAKAIVDWLPRAPQTALLCEAEGRGRQDEDKGAHNAKIAFAEARILRVVGLLDEVSMRLAAADMAERVLPIFRKVFPDDHRPAQATQAARYFARGKIDDATRAASAAAAWDASGDASGDAARAASRAASAAAWDASAAVAWGASRDAAWAASAAAWGASAAAAWGASGDAAWAASAAAWGASAAARAASAAAAWGASRDAAWAAARAASRAASAASGAASDASRDAARDANAKIIIAQAKARLAEEGT